MSASLDAVSPLGWEVETLRSLGRWVGGGTPSKAEPAFWTNGTIPWVSAKDMKTAVIERPADLITEDAVARSSAKRIQAGSVLCVMRSGILAHTFPVAVNAVEVTINQDLRALVVREGVDAFYLAHFLRFSSGTILLTCSKHGTTVSSIDASRLDRFPVPLPPIETQRRIVARIDELFSELDDGEEGLARARSELEIYRKSLLRAAITGELTADWRAGASPREAAETVLARISERQGRNLRRRSAGEAPSRADRAAQNDLPIGWAWTTLPTLGEFGRGKSKHRPRNDPRLYGGEYPFVQTGVVAASRGLITTYQQTYTEFGLAQSKLWPAGTLCITIAANIAKTGVLTFDACFPDSVVGLACGDGVIPAYVELVVRSLQADLERDAPATAQKNINLETFTHLPIPLPPTAEQEAVVAAFQEAEAAAEMLVRDDLDRDVATLRQSILAAAFRGELT